MAKKKKRKALARTAEIAIRSDGHCNRYVFAIEMGVYQRCLSVAIRCCNSYTSGLSVNIILKVTLVATSKPNMDLASQALSCPTASKNFKKYLVLSERVGVYWLESLFEQRSSVHHAPHCHWMAVLSPPIMRRCAGHYATLIGC